MQEKRTFILKRCLFGFKNCESLVTIVNISSKAYERFLSGKNILYNEPRPFTEIFPKPTMLCLIEQSGEPAYAIANRVMQSQNYDFEKLDVTTHN